MYRWSKPIIGRSIFLSFREGGCCKSVHSFMIPLSLMLMLKLSSASIYTWRAPSLAVNLGGESYRHSYFCTLFVRHISKNELSFRHWRSLIFQYHCVADLNYVTLCKWLVTLSTLWMVASTVDFKCNLSSVPSLTFKNHNIETFKILDKNVSDWYYYCGYLLYL